MTWIAQLPMYDLPEIRWASDALWRGVAARLERAGLTGLPERLARELSPAEAWRHPGLLLGQSCGYPAMTAFRDELRILATPLYAAPGCEGPLHCSFIVVAVESDAAQLRDLRGTRFALNGRESNTGMNLPRRAIAPLAERGRFFAAVIETGSHAESLARVAAGTADCAAIDCVTHALLVRHRPATVARTRILEHTGMTPSLPFVTARGTDQATAALMRAAIIEAAADPALAESREALFLAGAIAAEPDDYAVVIDNERRARELGYGELR
jgi:ABC-type phosphate/phosphonate transport system substrate-binding protein